MYVKTDVLVIGGGVMGLSTAYYLSRMGKQVTLAEKREIGAGASSACDDMILLQSKKPGVSLILAMESLDMYRTLGEELHAQLDFETRGGMIVIENERELAVMERFVEQQRACGLKVEILDRRGLREKQPHIDPRMIASTYSAGDSQVNPFFLMRALLHRAVSLGLNVLRNAPVTGIEPKGDHWMVFIEGGGRIECEFIVNAAGAWTKEIGNMVGIDIPIVPRKGQLAVTEQIAPIGETNVWSAAYIASKFDKTLLPEAGPYEKEIGLGFSFSQTAEGNYLIGSTRESAGYDKSTSERAISTLVRQACGYFPILRSVNIIRTIAGFRPATPDGDSIVGPVSGLPGFYIAAGHEGDGIALAPVTGRSIANMICHGEVDEIFQKLNISRFTANA